MILGIASATTQRMAGLVNSILDVSRLENGRMPLEWTVFSLADLTADTLQMQETLADEKAIHLQNDVPKTLVPAWGDSGLIGRVLQNLIGNAIKFTPAKGTVCVAARLERREDHPVILVQVSDTGDGIPPEIQNRLFQKFVTGSQEGRGSGLGLAFCKLALETHGERIWVESQPGHGTTFSFSLAVATETIK
jgi:signal transduction histidine kinase